MRFGQHQHRIRASSEDVHGVTTAEFAASGHAQGMRPAEGNEKAPPPTSQPASPKPPDSPPEPPRPSAHRCPPRTSPRAPRATRARRTVSAAALFVLALTTASATALATAPATALPTLAAAAEDPDTTYAFAEDAQSLAGGQSPDSAPALKSGGTYRGSLGPGAVSYYRLELDGSSSAHISATAVPPAGSTANGGDGIQVAILQGTDENGTDCDSGDAGLETDDPSPLTASASRVIGPNQGNCQEAGMYTVRVERSGSSAGSWGLELRYAQEPGLRGPTPTAPSGVPDGSTSSPTGAPRQAEGGTGFNDAADLKPGVWTDELTPGTTRFYRVPVDWGQRLTVSAAAAGGGNGDSGTSSGTSGSSGSAAGLTLTVYDPVRAPVADDSATSSGEAAVQPIGPVAYQNRFGTGQDVTGSSIAGWYYLAVQLPSRGGAGKAAMTLRLGVDGEPTEAPPYDGVPRPAAAFNLTDDGSGDSALSPGGTDGPGSGPPLGRTTLTALAAGGFGTGTLLLLVLALWTALARRRGRRLPPVTEA